MSFVKSMRLRSLGGLGAVLLGIALWLALAAPAVAKPIEFGVSLINPPEGLGRSQPATTHGACGFSSSPGFSVHFLAGCLQSLEFEGNTIQQGGMLVEKKHGRIVSVQLILDAGDPGPKTPRYVTDEINIDPPALAPVNGGTIIINASNVPVRKFEKGVGRKSPRGPSVVGTVNVGKAEYFSK